MNIILQQVSVADYDEFKRRAKQRLNWSNIKYNDKKNGRLKIHPLELRELQRIADELKVVNIPDSDIQNRVHCNAGECMLFEYNKCVFNTPAECPKYHSIK